MRVLNCVRGASAVPILLGVLVAGTPIAAAQAGAAKNPVVLELFTSEGCSSCPPIDRWIERLDAAQPLPGAELIVLSEHVNYWDHDGWKDPYSSAALTERQQNYVHELGLSGAYTPQVLLDGTVEMQTANPHDVREELNKAAATERMPVSIDDARFDDGAVTGKVTVQGGSKHGDVLVAVALDRTETNVLGGENGGEKLTNVAVVLGMVKIGKTEKGKVFDQPFRVPVTTADGGALRVIALVQEGGMGPMVGAGMVKVASTGRAAGR